MDEDGSATRGGERRLLLVPALLTRGRAAGAPSDGGPGDELAELVADRLARREALLHRLERDRQRRRYRTA